MLLERDPKNPILGPNIANEWEATAATHPTIIKTEREYCLLYRAVSRPKPIRNINMSVSSMPVPSIGIARSQSPTQFSDTAPFILPERNWEIFGCADPSITKIDKTYYILYNAFSSATKNGQTVKVGLATSEDMQIINEKYIVTPFNAKNMALFPEPINGKYYAILTVNPDLPPARIAVAELDKLENLWGEGFWKKWYAFVADHALSLYRVTTDHVEVGSAPIKTKDGWLVLVSYVKNYFSQNAKHHIEAVLLDLHNPTKVIGRVAEPLLVAQEVYERSSDPLEGAFPSGAYIEGDTLYVYYGAGDGSSAVATCKIDDLLARMQPYDVTRAKRYYGNPILRPRPEYAWEYKGSSNPSALYLDNKMHLIYRAIATDETSTFAHASSSDGLYFEERTDQPIYVPKAGFEDKKKPGGSGCADPRLTQIGERVFMTYTAYDGLNPARVALTSIAAKDFVEKRWRWEPASLISAPGTEDRDACILPEQIEGKYVIIHRVTPNIVFDFVDDLDFGEGKKWLGIKGIIQPRTDSWDSERIGIAGTPIKTEVGWLAFYYGISSKDAYCRVGAMLLGLTDPSRVLARTEYPILEPEFDYERIGNVNNTVFPCGAVLLGQTVFLYYGGAGKTVGVATLSLPELLAAMQSHGASFME